MGTGGGWQDQVGGITGGIKLARTTPGPDQRPSIHWCAFDFAADPALRSRCLLYFTGIKRMARDILQKVVLRYLARDPDMLRIVDRLKAGAEELKRALDMGDHDALIEAVESYWRMKQRIDPGSTNPQIEALLEPINHELDARLLPGRAAGGSCS
jgi:fucokinase